jgi:hypothetical protein
MTEPTTEAGRRLMSYGIFKPQAILAIEAEARADALREAAERVRDMANRYVDVPLKWEALHDVLAILDPETEP